MYKGDPGRLADYDLTIKCSNGTQITARVDLKLLLNKLTLSDQVAHDAELLLASTLFTDEVFGERRADSRSNIKIEETSSEFDKEKLQERLAKLSGGVAVIRVGAATETELKEKKLRIEDALNASKISAV